MLHGLFPLRSTRPSTFDLMKRKFSVARRVCSASFIVQPHPDTRKRMSHSHNTFQLMRATKERQWHAASTPRSSPSSHFVLDFTLTDTTTKSNLHHTIESLINAVAKRDQTLRLTSPHHSRTNAPSQPDILPPHRRQIWLPNTGPSHLIRRWRWCKPHTTQRGSFTCSTRKFSRPVHVDQDLLDCNFVSVPRVYQKENVGL